MCRLVKRRLARITYAAAVLVPFSLNQGGADSQTKLPVVVSNFVPRTPSKRNRAAGPELSSYRSCGHLRPKRAIYSSAVGIATAVFRLIYIGAEYHDLTFIYSRSGRYSYGERTAANSENHTTRRL